MDIEEFTLRDHDERDDDDRQIEPCVKWQPLFEAADIHSLPETAGTLAILVVNRPLPEEFVPGCVVSIAGKTSTTDITGVAEVDISSIPDGRHRLQITAPEVFEGEVGPGFPDDTSKKHIWRRFEGKLRIQGGNVVEADPADWITIAGSHKITVRLQPVWIKAFKEGKANDPDLIVIHHTHGRLPYDLKKLTSCKSVHYFVADYGEVYKLVDELRTAEHAGHSYWQRQEGLNSRSIGIEISHLYQTEFPRKQIDAVVELVTRLKAAFPHIPARRYVGHSDIGLCYENDDDCLAGPKRIGRKAEDPGSAFPWERIEALGVSFTLKDGGISPEAYGGFFRLVPDGKLRNGDNDREQRYGGQIRPEVRGAVAEVQQDLIDVGYYCDQADGSYGEVTLQAVKMFQRHIFSGPRRTGHPDQYTSGDGRFDLATAEYLKRVLGEVEVLTGVAYLARRWSRSAAGFTRRLASRLWSRPT